VTLVLEPRHLDALRRHGEVDYPREACGLIGGAAADGRKVAFTIVPARNARADAPRHRYLIDPDAFRRAQDTLDRDGLEVIGVYHSHPDHPPVPSAFDRENAWPWLSYVIVEVRGGRAGEHKSWVLADDRRAFAEETIWQSQS
jgi:proteasome lid subunit RPN8/RPN11